MIGITQQQYDEAMNASARLQEVSDLIRHASLLLDNMERRFMSDVEAIDGAEAVATSLAVDLTKLADRIAADADHAAERVE